MILIKHLLEPLLNLEGADGAQALKRGGKVGENRTPSYGKYTRQKTSLARHLTFLRVLTRFLNTIIVSGYI